ncbi:chemotaxis protein [Eubacterium xylanophilum]|uniref:chemotaxis protein n=1 Tax=Eubacterium xylanophilum TaxID=39497 RepID=UPI000478FB92|nr:chemotaxis protein [Eubacterium xylanophilum]
MANDISKTGILLESGTNELELLEFVVGGQHFGINVAKIRELCNYETPTPIPNSHEYIEGIYMPKDMLITAINLAKALGIPKEDNPSTDMYIVTNFNRVYTAFHVDQVVGIHRLSWEDMVKPDTTMSSAANASAIGVVKINGKVILVLDFEKILSEINPESGLRVSEIDMLGERDRSDVKILLAEDSAMLLEMMKDCLSKAGYVNLIPTSNGLEAWKELNKIIDDGGKIGEDISCVITDIEMPQMDGHRLLKLIKDDRRFNKLPVIIFSSLVNEEMRIKGKSLGADAQLSKPEIGNLVKMIDSLIGK